eukprot:gene41863-66071_t
MALPDRFETPLTRKLGIRYPIMVAGMGHVTGADLAVAVSNAGGIGTIGAIGMSPEGIRACMKARLKPGDSIAGTLPFGVDLLLPQVGGAARKTNRDYTGGQLGAMVDVMVEERVPLFVCAVGIPPKWVVEKMHAVGMLVMNMAGHPKHGGAHTGDISTLVLVPHPATVLVGGGGIFDGRGVAACMALGASGVWVGSRGDTRRIEIYSGRPLRVLKNPVNDYWAAHEQGWEGVVPIGKMYQDGEYAPGHGDVDLVQCGQG